MQLLQKTTNRRNAVDCAREIVHATPYVVGFIRNHMRQHRQGLSVTQFRALVFLDRFPGNTLSALAEFLGASLSTTSRLVAGLVKRGLVRRSARGNDRREMALDNTAAGRTFLNVAWSATQKQLAGQLRHLSIEEMETITSAMKLLFGLFGTRCQDDIAPGIQKD